MPSSGVVLITGCSQGSLGSALALAFRAKGAQVIATARSEAKLEHFQTQSGIETRQLDVSDGASIKACVASVQHLDILVNNAGGLYAMPLADADLKESKRLFDLNVWGQLAVTQAFLPLLVRSKGLIVNQTSISSVVNVPWNGVYCSSKAALAMITDILRLELEPLGVRVVELKTGAVRSGFYEHQNFHNTSTLPESSVYHKARKPIEKSMTGESVKAEAVSADLWAKQVVDVLLKNKDPEPRIWKGKNATAVWFAKRFMSPGFLNGNMRKLGALDEVGRALRS